MAAVLVVIDSLPFNRPDAAQRTATKTGPGARAILNLETEQWDVVISSDVLIENSMAAFRKSVRDSPKAEWISRETAAEEQFTALVEMLSRETDSTHYRGMDLEGLL